MRDFLINISAGVALSGISWLLFRAFAPIYLAWRYKAPRLDGQWSFFDSDDPHIAPVGSASIRQTGEKISANVTRTISRKGKPLSRSFSYSGKVRDGQMLISFEEPISNGFIAGHIVLKVSGDLKTLSGFTVYLDRDSGDVVAHRITFRRI